MGIPRWLDHFEQERKAGARVFIFTGNVGDLVYWSGSPLLPCRLNHFLMGYMAKYNYYTYNLSIAEGLTLFNPSYDDKVPKLRGHSKYLLQAEALTSVLAALCKQLRQPSPPIAIVVDHADHLCPASRGSAAGLSSLHVIAIETFHSWSVDAKVQSTDNLVILISYENQINDLLVGRSSGCQVIRIDLPDESTRAGFIALRLKKQQAGRGNSVLPPNLSPQRLAQISNGLRLWDMEGLFRRCEATGTLISRATVAEAKSDVIRQLSGGLLEVFEPTYGLEQVGGLLHLKRYVNNLVWRWFNGAKKDLPQSLLLVGPPGCGKSFSVQAIAHALRVPCVAMRNIREQWVGASERNLETVLSIIETLSPCVVWIDEVDQVLGQRTTGQSLDAGTSERMMARFWEFTGTMEHRGRILWIATTNRPDLLDAALVDRFPVVIPILHPTRPEIPELLPQLAQQIDRQIAPNEIHVDDFKNIHLLTVRALQEIVVKAGEIADIEATQTGVPIKRNHLQEAIRLYKPNYSQEMHELLALTALRMTTFEDLLPWNAGAMVPYYVADLLVGGRLDHGRLEKRLQQLQTVLAREQFNGGL